MEPSNNYPNEDKIPFIMQEIGRENFPLGLDHPNEIPVCGNNGCEILDSLFESDDIAILKKYVQDEINWLYKEAERLQKEQIDTYRCIARLKYVMEDVKNTKDLEVLTRSLIRDKVYG